ncbi:MAG: HAMP domain-containing histidine kinase [Anaerolineae bacterium]|jgi:signal transduction histidine kinase|nr:HAMP domain-containing histidine kinase [Anaerolineae bacterium]
MIKYFREHLGAKLFLSYFAVILIGAIALWATTRLTVETAFDRHLGTMEEFTSSGSGMGLQAGKPDDETGEQRGEFRNRLYDQFQNSFQEALGWSAIAAGIAAITVSLYLSRRVIIPVRAMTSASQRISDGHYDERVQEQNQDELGQLAHSFNQMAAKLEEVEEMRRQLIGDVAHELRTPLTTIKGSVEALEDGILPASPETYQIILHEAERLNHLVDDLQELSRVEAGAYELDLQPLQLSSVQSSIQKRFGHQFAEKGVSLESQIPSDLPLVQADEHRIIQVLTNLLANALHYTTKGGEVKLSASQFDSEIQVTIRDNGTGIPAEHLENIFTRFYRADKSRARNAGGSGIGLTITKHLVEAHGGKIWAKSDGEGKGSSFIFALPIDIA